MASDLAASTRMIVASPYFSQEQKQLCTRCHHARIEHSTTETPAVCHAVEPGPCVCPGFLAEVA